MSQFTKKNIQLFSAVINNLNGGKINSLVIWDQAALDAGYKDSRNARAMWNRLVKKLVDANGDGDNNNAGKSTSTTPSSKKRKTAGTPQADSSTAKVGRPSKKTKGSGDGVDQLNDNAENGAAAANVETECRPSEDEAP